MPVLLLSVNTVSFFYCFPFLFLTTYPIFPCFDFRLLDFLHNSKSHSLTPHTLSIIKTTPVTTIHSSKSLSNSHSFSSVFSHHLLSFVPDLAPYVLVITSELLIPGA
ncbi:hypothetical protein HanXRQr2_Chr12g0562591 [Helianthus annuus]|uniref:Uncharacterized protein n=1 Tax=Helianthus annuus TaxID=4232 RepID=A0A251T563_HELAN|nr:hypothetical protein HanXRQr2_Chr12g0562591 [Helianthus annuus]KAJ0490954.1 hypothetical protein HanHA300_Chr12g0461471 [Helianthus annuus]KAJ0506859.1 hypothetical protein HanHA89_Chr12g0486871 [Helianthus annuus]